MRTPLVAPPNRRSRCTVSPREARRARAAGDTSVALQNRRAEVVDAMSDGAWVLRRESSAYRLAVNRSSARVGRHCSYQAADADGGRRTRAPADVEHENPPCLG